jgi:hypothetical protein
MKQGTSGPWNGRRFPPKRLLFFEGVHHRCIPKDITLHASLAHALCKRRMIDQLRSCNILLNIVVLLLGWYEYITSFIYCWPEESSWKWSKTTPLCSSGQSSWLQIQKSWFDSRRYQIFWEVVGLERGPLSLVSTIEELHGRNDSGSCLENREYARRDQSYWLLGTPSAQNWH